MDVVEFAERFMNVKLQEWQKEHIRVLEKLPRDAKIVMAPHGRVYIYMTERSDAMLEGTDNILEEKENINEHQNARQPTYHSGYKSRIHAHDELDRSSSRC